MYSALRSYSQSMMALVLLIIATVLFALFMTGPEQFLRTYALTFLGCRFWMEMDLLSTDSFKNHSEGTRRRAHGSLLVFRPVHLLAASSSVYNLERSWCFTADWGGFSEHLPCYIALWLFFHGQVQNSERRS